MVSSSVRSDPSPCSLPAPLVISPKKLKLDCESCYLDKSEATRYKIQIGSELRSLILLCSLLPSLLGIADGLQLSKRNTMNKGAKFYFANSYLRRMDSFSCLQSNPKRVELLRACCGAKIEDNVHIGKSSFYQRINSPRHVLAPMVAQSDLAFRLMCEQLYDVDLSYTQMIHACNFVSSSGETFRRDHLDVYPESMVSDVLLGQADRRRNLVVSPSQARALQGLTESDVLLARKRILAASHRKFDALRSSQNASDEPSSTSLLRAKPTVVQIAAHDPKIALEASWMILEKSGTLQAIRENLIPPVAAIDLNLGCPQKIARKGKYGSFLHDEHPRSAYDVLYKLRSELPQEVGVTAKIRLPPSQSDADAGKLGNIFETNGPPTIEERIRCLIDCGVDLITVHGRTRFENKVAVGAADWNAIRRSVEIAKSYSGDKHYPIFANGGIEFSTDIEQCLKETGANGVMSSESLLENPGLFDSGNSVNFYSPRGLLERQLGYANLYLDYATLFPPLPGSLGNRGGCFNVIRSHLFKFLHRYLEENPDLRSSLGDQQLRTIKQARELVSELRSRYDTVNETQLKSRRSWHRDSSWYRRHRRPEINKRSDSKAVACANVDNNSRTQSLEERKKIAKMRIKKLQEDRRKRESEANFF